MNFQFYAEKLLNSNNFKNFKKKHPDAYFCSGFFVVDKEGKDNKTHFDYYLPKEGKLVSFQLENKIQQVDVEMLDKKKLSKVSIDLDFDLEKIEKLIEKEMTSITEEKGHGRRGQADRYRRGNVRCLQTGGNGGARHDGGRRQGQYAVRADLRIGRFGGRLYRLRRDVLHPRGDGVRSGFRSDPGAWRAGLFHRPDSGDRRRCGTLYR